jgi:hypothetical protein
MALVLFVVMDLVMDESISINKSMYIDMSFHTYAGKEMDMVNIT